MFWIQAQSVVSLYGTTTIGGTDGAGCIFHINPENGQFTFDYSPPAQSARKPLRSTLADAGNGKCYGVTRKGGMYGDGAFFEWDTSGAIRTIGNFNVHINGGEPVGCPVLYEGKYYGLTLRGGNANGVIYSFDPSSGIIEKKAILEPMGSDPQYVSLCLCNNKFYFYSLPYPAIWEYDPALGSLTKKIEFSPIQYYPYLGLLSYENKLWGVFPFGGSTSNGFIFEWDPETNILIPRHDFSGSVVQCNSFVEWNGKFYDISEYGLARGAMIFEFDPVTYSFRKVTAVTQSGDYFTTLTVCNGKFYTMAQSSSPNSGGRIIEWDPVDNTISLKYDFSLESGAYPTGCLITMYDKVYGLTDSYGKYKCGTIFEFDPVLDSFKVKTHLGKADLGNNLQGGLTLYKGNLYGVSVDGGESGCGVIYKFNPENREYSKILDFDAAIASAPTTSMSLHNDKLYGITNKGGIYLSGTIYEFDPLTSSIIKRYDLKDFDYSATELTFYDGKFYGIRSKLWAHYYYGYIFSWDPVTGIYQVEFEFPEDVLQKGPFVLTLFNNKFYGATNGPLFEWDPQTKIYTPYYIPGNFTFRYPLGQLTLHNNRLFGCARYGAAGSDGYIFSWDPATNSLQEEYEFDYSPSGWWPGQDLISYKDRLFGVARGGGLFHEGTAFSLDPTTGLFTKYHDFNGLNGSVPISGFTVYEHAINQNELKEVDNEYLLEIYPNPAKEVVKLSTLRSEAMSEIEIYDISGERVLNKKVAGISEINLNISLLNPGFYSIKVRLSDDSVLTGKLVIQ